MVGIVSSLIMPTEAVWRRAKLSRVESPLAEFTATICNFLRRFASKSRHDWLRRFLSRLCAVYSRLSLPISRFIEQRSKILKCFRCDGHEVTAKPKIHCTVVDSATRVRLMVGVNPEGCGAAGNFRHKIKVEIANSK